MTPAYGRRLSHPPPRPLKSKPSRCFTCSLTMQCFQDDRAGSGVATEDFRFLIFDSNGKFCGNGCVLRVARVDIVECAASPRFRLLRPRPSPPIRYRVNAQNRPTPGRIHFGCPSQITSRITLCSRHAKQNPDPLRRLYRLTLRLVTGFVTAWRSKIPNRYKGCDAVTALGSPEGGHPSQGHRTALLTPSDPCSFVSLLVRSVLHVLPGPYASLHRSGREPFPVPFHSTVGYGRFRSVTVGCGR